MYLCKSPDGEEVAVDIETLQAWALAGRIAPASVLVQIKNGKPIAAGQLTALQPLFNRKASFTSMPVSPLDTPWFEGIPRWSYWAAGLLLCAILGVALQFARPADALKEGGKPSLPARVHAAAHRSTHYSRRSRHSVRSHSH